MFPVILNFVWACINFLYCAAIHGCPNHSPASSLIFLFLGLGFTILSILELQRYIGRRKK